ncbi:MAG: hypothetical protein ACRYFY_02570 [Janthinobacterium lividum]
MAWLEVLADKDVGDIGAVSGLLATVEGTLGSVIAAGAYDGRWCTDGSAG